MKDGFSLVAIVGILIAAAAMATRYREHHAFRAAGLISSSNAEITRARR